MKNTPLNCYSKAVLQIHEFWYGSGCGFGSTDLYLRLRDPDPAIFGSNLDVNKDNFFLLSFFCLLHNFSKIKRHKEVTKQ
jgi:hypothetical protein